MTITNNVVVKIAGPAGYGIMSASQRFCESMVLGGLNVVTRAEYPSLIRGGHNSVSIRVSNKEIGCSRKDVNLLIALNKESFNIHKKELIKGSGIIIDNEKANLDKKQFKNFKLYNIPISKIIKEIKVDKVMANTVAVGAAIAILGYNQRLLDLSIEKDFKKRKKSKKIIKENIKAAEAGYNYAKENYKGDFDFKLKKQKKKKKIMLTGNHALALGAIKAGCKFLSAYPMTPSTSIMQYFAKKEKDAGIVMKQAFDEITAINMSLGASFAGVRAMASTSGGGIGLMTETISLLGLSEIPLVVVDVQRPGPATGLPTRQGQGDFKFVLNTGHGDFPRIVLAPGDYEEFFREGFNAFNLADIYQLPVLIISDKHMASSLMTVKPFSMSGLKIKRGNLLTDNQAAKIKDYKRYSLTKTGISNRAIPGQKAVFRSSSDEHDEYGNIFEGADNRVLMEEKRMRKLKKAINDIPLPKLYGPKKADITLISWGSTKNSILEAIDILNQKGKKVNFMHFVYLFPFHTDYVTKFLKKCKKVVCVEENISGQFAGYIREKTGIKVKKLNKYNGRAFFPEEIVEKVKKL
jgi:2-oxoglutarate ferredoxin oxidoreductase subunit alpha